MPHHTIRTALLALGLAGLTACTTAGGGGGSAANVPAGRSTTVDFFSVFNPQNCLNGPRPSTKIVQPANGTVRIVPGTNTFAPDNFGARGRKCAGQPIRGVRAVYTPKPGYRGPDSFTVRYSYSQRIGARKTANRTYRVNVQ